jgi:dolichyl-phosphate beta-glucosyltransferase
MDPTRGSHVELSFVVPLYDEARNIPVLERAFEEFFATSAALFPSSGCEVILVDDGSTDETRERLRELASRWQTSPGLRCQVLGHETNLGKGAALKTGVAAAKGRWILTLDADMATTPDELRRWVRTGLVNLANDDERIIYVGSREHPESDVRDSSSRRSIGRIFNALVQIIAGLYVNDSQCGFKLYPRPVAKTLFQQLGNTGWAHDVELLLRAARMRCRIVSLPIRWRAGVESKVRVIPDAAKMFVALFSIRIRATTETLLAIRSVVRGEGFQRIHWTSLAYATILAYAATGMWNLATSSDPGGGVGEVAFSAVSSDAKALGAVGNFALGLLGGVGGYKLGALLIGPLLGFGLTLVFVSAAFAPWVHGETLAHSKALFFFSPLLSAYAIQARRHFPRVPKGLVAKILVTIGLCAWWLIRSV